MAIAIAPYNIFFFAFPNILNVKILIATTPARTSAPNNVPLAFSATFIRNIDDISIRPVNAVNISAELAALRIDLLFLDNNLAVGIMAFTIKRNANAPNVPISAGTIEMVKNIDVTTRFPINTVIFFAAFVPASISFLFFFNSLDIVNIEFLPTKISLNFSITFVFKINTTPKLTLDKEFTISGAAFINLMMLLSSFSFIFKSSFDFLNIFFICFNFLFPKKISINEIFLSLLNASISEFNPPPVFCLLMFFAMASATISDALSLNFATVGILGFPCFNITLERLSIAFLIPFVSSRISCICLVFIFDWFPPPISTGFFFVDAPTIDCKRFLISFTIVCILFLELCVPCKIARIS